MNDRLWIVGKYVEATPEKGVTWEFMGVFDSEDAAVAHCSLWECFVGPCRLNEPLPAELQPWPGLYYPQARAAGVEGS